MLGLAALIIYGPWSIATAWDSFLVHYRALESSLKDGRTLDVILDLVDVGSLIIPVIGGGLVFALVVKRWSAAAWRWSKGKPLLLRAGLLLALVATAGLLFLIWGENLPASD